MPVIPALPTSIGYAVASILGLVLTWYVGSFLVKWVQAYQNWKQTNQATQDRNTAQEGNRAANSDSDALKKIDGR